MKSYNCFYSALFNILEPQFQEDTNLLINNRWQFFYNPSIEYSDDMRIVGEHPLPFDITHIERLRTAYNINIQMIKVKGGLDELLENIQKNSYVIVFANKYLLNGLYKTLPEKRCVTTIKIDSLQQDMIHYSVFDNNMSVSKIDISLLEKAWLNASDYSILNESIIKVSVNDTLNSFETADTFFWQNLLNSTKYYLNNVIIDNVFYGHKGLEIFATAICDWELLSCQKLIDCSMYIEFIIKQRESIQAALESVCPQQHLTKIMSTVGSIIEIWKKVKMFFFIVGKREQFESIKYISDQIRTIAEMEYLCLTDLVKMAGENI